ncbi:MAG TPA: hypothetical protein VEH08_03890 [Methanomassiliicoccales archaeon]|nr:hypothetical protein [Methanomassiliicoccales archaeon]
MGVFKDGKLVADMKFMSEKEARQAANVWGLETGRTLDGAHWDVTVTFVMGREEPTVHSPGGERSNTKH